MAFLYMVHTRICGHSPRNKTQELRPNLERMFSLIINLSQALINKGRGERMGVFGGETRKGTTFEM
jgi:phosphopantothenate synthetase